MSGVLADFRHAVRSLRVNPAFSLVAITTLALGIAASVAGFTLANWLVLRPTPGVRDAGRIAIIWFGERLSGGVTQSFPVGASQLPAIAHAVPALGILAGHMPGEANVGTGRAARHVDLDFVSPGYFTVLGTRPELGALFREGDDGTAGPLLAVLGHDLWLDLFDGDSSVVGKPAMVGSLLFTVAGVAPFGFHGIDRGRRVDLWLPGRAAPLLEAARGGPAPSEPYYSEFVSRLAERATFDQVEQQLDAVSERLIGQSAIVFQGVGIWPPIRASAEDTARLLLAVTGLVLLIACANVANLLLFRGLLERSQTAMRKVLGAGVARLVRERLVMSLLLAVLAGALGMLLSRWLVDAFQGLSLWRSAAPLGQVPIDWRVAVFASGIALASALIAGTAPALVAARTDLAAAVRGSAITQPQFRVFRRTFAGLQIALCPALLVGALLVARTLQNLGRIRLGFDPDGVSAVSIAPPGGKTEKFWLQRYYRALLREVQEVPGVESAGLGSSYPLARGTFGVDRVVPDGAGPDATPVMTVETPVSTGYFEALRIPILAGRGFTDEEALGTSDSLRPVAMISQSLARRLFGDRNPVGRHLGPDPRLEIIGVAGDVRYVDLEAVSSTPWRGGELLYLPLHNRTTGTVSLVVRSQGPHAAIMARIRAVAARLDPSIPLYGEVMLRDAVTRYLSDRILFARLLGILSAIAVGLAAIGLYGVIAYGVASRTREIGIRVALGALPAKILSAVLAEALVIGAASVLVGLGAAMAVARLLQSRLYGIGPFDPTTYVTAGAILLSVAMVAALVPARVATRVDPMVALRTE